MHHRWVRSSSADFGGSLPRPRSGHTAVNVGKSMIVFFGGFVDKHFISDISVYDIDNRLLFQPECTGNNSDGQVGPSPRAFHVSVSINCLMFVFGGRSSSKRLHDFWVLDTDVWQWTELTGFGDLPSPRDFAASSAIGNQKIVIFGGWDGKKWLSDMYILDTISLEWTELRISGSLPAPRCGHSISMLEKRLLVYGGRGGGGPVMGDLWALKGLIEEENEMPGWTQLKLPGQTPTPRCGHTFTSGGSYLLLFGGHGTGGWLSRYDIYYNDSIILDRVSAQWKRLITSEPPAPRAYHSMVSIGSRFLLFGGYDGKTTYGDAWWLIPEENPISDHFDLALPKQVNDVVDLTVHSNDSHLDLKENTHKQYYAVSELQRRLKIPVDISCPMLQVADELEDKEFLELATSLTKEVTSDKYSRNNQVFKAIRDSWMKCTPDTFLLKEIGPLLHDYQRMVMRLHVKEVNEWKYTETGFEKQIHPFFHLTDASQLRMDDIPRLLDEYRHLLTRTQL